MISLLLILSLSYADDLLTCRELSDHDKQSMQKTLKVDVAEVLRARLQPIHKSLYAAKDDSRFEQAEGLVKAFDADTWLERLKALKGFQEDHHTEIEFLFSFWVREKYLGLLARAGARSEKHQLDILGAKGDSNVRARVHAFPAEPRVTHISRFACSTPKDNASYRCSEPHVAVDVQLSPYVLCSAELEPSHLKYIVRLDPLRGPLIADVERFGQRIYQSTLSDLDDLKNHLSGAELFRELKSRTFFTAQDFNEIPGSGILSLRAPDSASSRMPASVPK